MTCVTDFGGTSVCRTESLIQSEIPYHFDDFIDGRYFVNARNN